MSEVDNTTYASIPAQYGRLISTHIPCPDVSLAQFLQSGRGSERFYWESARDDDAFEQIVFHLA